MRFLTSAILLVFLSCSSGTNDISIPKNCGQLIIVLTPSYDSIDGKLYRFAKDDIKNSEWTKISNPINVVVGRNGLAWGRGLHNDFPTDKPVKKEGDKCSPAGIFNLTYAIGLVSQEEMLNLKIPYYQLTESVYCIDDRNSLYYNEIVKIDTIKTIDWQSSVQLSKFKKQFKYGIFVNHNYPSKLKGAGSCIYLHIWKNQSKGTVGCTAMSEANMEEILQWIDSTKNPILIQLPKEEFYKYKKQWALSEIEFK